MPTSAGRVSSGTHSQPPCPRCGPTSAWRWWRLCLVAVLGFLAGLAVGATIGCQTALSRLDQTLTRLEARHPAAPRSALDTLRLYPLTPTRSTAP